MASGVGGQRSASSGWVARCHSDEPMALQVVSTPAMRTRAATPSTTLVLDGLPVDSAVQQVAQQVVARLGLAALHLVDEEVDQGRWSPRRRRSGSSANSSTSRTQPVKVSDSEAGTPEDAAMTRTGICWA